MGNLCCPAKNNVVPILYQNDSMARRWNYSGSRQNKKITSVPSIEPEDLLEFQDKDFENHFEDES